MDEVLTTREKILSILKYSLISLIASIICGVIVGLLDVYSKGVSFTEYAIRVFADAFTVSGILNMLFFLLVVLAREGAFDMIVYGTKRFFIFIFKKNPEESSLPRTYFDYVVQKRGDKKRNHFEYLIFPFIFFVIGLILSIICA